MAILDRKHIQCFKCGAYYNAPESVNDIHDEFTVHEYHIYNAIQIDGVTPLTQKQINALMSALQKNADGLSAHNTFAIVYIKIGKQIIVNVTREHLDGILHMDTGDALTAKEFWVSCPKCSYEGNRVKL
jgi:hypothetical protein